MESFYYNNSNTSSNQTLTNQTVSHCDHIDTSLEILIDMKNMSEEHIQNPNVVVYFILLLISTVSILVGAKILKFVAATSAAIVVFYGVYKTSANTNGISCDMKIIISSAFALIAAMMMVCIIKLAFFVVGALSMFGLVHLTFNAFPELHSIYDTTQFFNKSIIYWACALVASLTGGLMFRCHQTLALEITTSILGSIGFAHAIYGLTEISGADIHKSVFLGIAVGMSTIGILSQRKLRRCDCRKKKQSE